MWSVLKQLFGIGIAPLTGSADLSPRDPLKRVLERVAENPEPYLDFGMLGFVPAKNYTFDHSYWNCGQFIRRPTH